MRQIKVIPFDINLVSSENVYTRDGRKVRIICTDRKHDTFPIVALVSNENNTQETYETYTIDGKFNDSMLSHDEDLFIHKELIINLCFEPFQKVLVRNNKKEVWRPGFFSHEDKMTYSDTGATEHRYWAIGNTRRSYSECLPYDDFKHLCNTTDDPEF